MKHDAITIRCPEGQTFVMPCWPADVAPHLDIKFVVHKTVTSFDEWAVSDVRTGMKIPASQEDSMTEAIESARKFLANITPERMSEVLRKAERMLSAEGHDIPA